MWILWDSHGDIVFKTEKKTFDSWEEMSEYINQDEELIDRLNHNWAWITNQKINEVMCWALAYVCYWNENEKIQKENSCGSRDAILDALIRERLDDNIKAK